MGTDKAVGSEDEVLRSAVGEGCRIGDCVGGEVGGVDKVKVGSLVDQR